MPSPTKLITVRFNPQSASTNPVTVHDATGAPVDIITITQKTDFVFTADDANSDAPIRGFGIVIAPKPENDIVNVIGNTKPRLTFTDTCQDKGDIKLYLTVQPPHGPIPESHGRPIIRNLPTNPIPQPRPVLQRVVAGVVIVGAILALVYYLYAR